MQFPAVKNLIIYLFLWGLLSFSNLNANPNYFAIKVIDQETGRGIPLVELTTLNHIQYYTDSNGLIAFFEPGLMNRYVYFKILSPGYIYPKPKDYFGFRGIAFKTIPGNSAVIQVKRINIAERLYRTTGAGIYRDSYLLGVPTPIQQAVINADVLGQDSILGALYKGKLFWIWGDTFKPSHPMGNFSISAATSELPEKGGLDPVNGIDFNYFVDSTGFSKKMIQIPGPGYVWFDWLLTIKDKNNTEKLIAKYARVNAMFENYERGLALFNDQTEQFEKYQQIDKWLDELHSTVHPFQAKVNQKLYYFFTSEFRFLRVKPNLQAIANPAAYEAFTCLATGEKYDKQNPKLDRGPDGKLIYAWKLNTDPIDIYQQKELIETGKIQQDEAWIQLRDFESGEQLTVKRGSIFWNSFRQKWIMIAGRPVGEIWYAEGDTPVGPWVYARKVMTSDISFYNPTQHPFFDQDGGRVIYFEGTFTNFLSKKRPIPRYEYNQIMYRLSLDDPRLFLPEPVYLVQFGNSHYDYQLRETVAANNNWSKVEKISFFAFPPQRKQPGLIPVFRKSLKSGICLFTPESGEHEGGTPIFYALPAEMDIYDLITGRWNFKMTNNVFFQKTFTMKIDSKNKHLQGIVDDQNFSIVRHPTISLSLKDSSFSITVKNSNQTYNLTGLFKKRKISGKWTTSDKSQAGSWEATPADEIWQPKYSLGTVPLYFYSNTDNSPGLYSTSNKTNTESLHQANKAICRVWKNPYALLILDYQAQAVRVEIDNF